MSSSSPSPFDGNNYNNFLLSRYYSPSSSPSSASSSPISNSFLMYNQSINANTLRAKMMIDDLMDPFTIIKLKNLDTERLIQIDQTLKNVVGALLDIKNHLGYGF